MDDVLAKSCAIELLARRKARERYADFLPLAFEILEQGKQLTWQWHLDLIAEYLTAAYHREIRRLMICQPPRTLKTVNASIAFVAWVLGKDPSEKFVCGSYADKLSIPISRTCRRLIEHPRYKHIFPDTHLQRGDNQSWFFSTTSGGYRIATSVGNPGTTGTITGLGGNFLIGDDLIKPEQVFSTPHREHMHSFLDHTWSSRKNDRKTCVEIHVCQRTHVHDAVGYLLSKDDTGDWTILNLERKAKEKRTISFGDFSRTVEQGEYLEPDRYGEHEEKQDKVALGSYGWEAQQQQSPRILGGGRFKTEYLKRYSAIPIRYDEIVDSYDTASSEKEINDPTGCIRFGRVGNQWHIVSAWKSHLTFPQLKRKVINFTNTAKVDALLIENKSSGIGLIQELKEASGSYPVVPVNPTKEKVARMDINIPWVEAGNLSMPDDDSQKSPWMFDFISTVEEFPNCVEFEYIDCLSQFIDWVKQRMSTVGIVIPDIPKVT